MTSSFINDVWGKVSSSFLALTTWTLESLGITHIVKARKSCWDPKTSNDHKCCGDCMMGKQHKAKILKESSIRSTRKNEWINSNLCGPFIEASLGGSKYVVVFLDDFSRKSWTLFLKAKSNTFEKLKNFKSMIEDGNNKIRMLKTDWGGEFLSKEFNFYYE